MDTRQTFAKMRNLRTKNYKTKNSSSVYLELSRCLFQYKFLAL